MEFLSPSKNRSTKSIDLFSPISTSKKRIDLLPPSNSKSAVKRRINEKYEVASSKKRVPNIDDQNLHPQNSISIAATPSKSAVKSDRFIPHRGNMDADFSYYYLTNNQVDENTLDNDLKPTPGEQKYKEQIQNMIKTGINGKRLVDCRAALAPTLLDRIGGHLGDQLQLCRETKVQEQVIAKKNQRVFPTIPYKILDAPDLLNDYYLNLLHWGKSNRLCIALGPTAYLWHPEDGSIETLVTLENNDYVSSVQWNADASYLALGTSSTAQTHVVQLWDPVTQQLIRELPGHHQRVSSLAWCTNDLISSGGRDSLILNHDIRAPRNIISYYTGHAQEVCGLAWSPDGSTLASGGNENLLCIWDSAMSHRSRNSQSSGGLQQQSYNARLIFDEHHTAAVKAVSWCPWQRNVVATGGGTADRTIRIWNSATGDNLHCVDTGSQVCAIQWSDHTKELVSSHGFSDNQLIVWKYADMSKLHEFHGHTARVLHLAKSPCGNTICSASADETLRFWNIFDASSCTTASKDHHLLSPMAKSVPGGVRNPKTSAQSQLLLHTPGNHLYIR